MSAPIYMTKTLAAASANNIALSQTPGGAGDLTLNGSTVTAGVATLDTARQVLFTFAANETGHTFVVYGNTGEGFVAIQESVAGTNGGIVATSNSFKKITRISISAAATGALTVGTNGVGTTAWRIVSRSMTPADFSLWLEVSGTVNVTVQYTYDDPSGTYPNPSTVTTTGFQTTATGALIAFPVAFNHPAMTALTANSEGTLIGLSIAALRLMVNSGTGTAQLGYIQSGIAGP